MKKTILLLFVLLWGFASEARSLKEFHADVPYGSHERQIFDVWLPKSLNKTPLVIYIHGGGFVQGSKDEMRNHRIIDKYLKAGVAFAAINYRFLKHISLQQIMREDMAGFVQFIRYNSKKYNIDKKLIMSHGFSAGGSASLWLGTHDDIADLDNLNPVKRESSRIIAAGHLSAQVSYDFIDWYHYFDPAKVDLYLGKQVWSRYHLESKDELFTEKGIAIRQDLDMFENMSSDDAPVLFWNGLPDRESEDNNHFMHSPRHAQLLYERAQSVGLEAEIILDGDRIIKSDIHKKVMKFFFRKIKEHKPLFGRRFKD
jgi:hypothetical protein